LLGIGVATSGILKMIKINLIPVKEKKKRTELLAVFAIVGVGLLLSLALGGYYLQKRSVLKNLEVEIEKITEESKAYEEKIREIKELEAKEASLNSFRTTIRNISEVQRKVVVAVDDFANHLPDGVWVTNLTQRAGAESARFSIQGFSFTLRGMETYLEALQKPGGTMGDVNMEIRNVSASVGGNRQIHQFEISAKILEASK
jgi:Tfp pilus assembly protein PilN